MRPVEDGQLPLRFNKQKLLLVKASSRNRIMAQLPKHSINQVLTPFCMMITRIVVESLARGAQ